ncbi:TBC domain-containing protein kinase-like protein [Galendromus occidentalis]|uniref:TBC domain-containing protein kinase-like protein n=1 Tax=Galendromus occidentalis TaxID=34638 RepID=A0AAJ6VX18_9ACAR|nr:TBC domain-containing protein kinase-like protein [Galendromus occidentalis]
MYPTPLASPGLSFAVHSFLASPHARNTCGHNGLPLTPNSVRILGRFQALKKLTHPCLATYLDLQRGKHERVVIVCESYERNCQKLLSSDKSPTAEINSFAHFDGSPPDYPEVVRRIFYESLHALAYLHRQNFVHHSVSLESIQLTDALHVKLSNHGTYFITENGACVPFPIGLPKYLPPEVLLDPKGLHSPKTDLWSLGIVLLELALRKELFNFELEEQIALVFECASSEKPVMCILERHKLVYEYLCLSEQVRDAIEACLSVPLEHRPSSEELLSHPYCDMQIEMLEEPPKGLPSHELIGADQIEECIENSSQLPEAWEVLNLHELYYFWRLTGGDALAEISKQRDYIRSRPAIFGLPNLTLIEGEDCGAERDSSYYYRDTYLRLPMDSLRERLKSVDPDIMFISISILFERFNFERHRSESFTTKTASELPLVIRERDIEYQIRRIFRFRKLVELYPLTGRAIQLEAAIDIPPYFRGHVWAALLGAQGDYHAEFDEIDKDTPTPMDRQIDVDIPRCHQYDQLLCSPVAHMKFRRLLKAWVSSHPQYVYWQGLDSLCAPFLSLHFNNEALAYQCLSRFVDKYLHKFFLQDNSQVIKEYLAVFSRLVTYHDPVLSLHLQKEDFIPDLYAIPWFLTMYTHVFALHKVYHLWDALLLRGEAFPLCVGVAILTQLREQLLTFGFNECILTFTDMPELDIERLVKDAVDIFDSTPQSICFRSHSKRPISGMTPLSLETLREELTPRISTDDFFIALSAPSSKDASGRTTLRERVLVLDVRPKEEYLEGCLRGAVNIPKDVAFTPEGKLASCPEASALAAHKGNIIVVFGNEEDRRKVANQLVHLDYRHVCILDTTVHDIRIRMSPPICLY